MAWLWTGRGLLAPLTAAAVFGLFVIALRLAMGPLAFGLFPALWAMACLVSALAVWSVGRSINGRSMSVRRMKSPRELVEAKNSFLMLAAETWALPLLAAAIALAVKGRFFS